MRKLLFKNNIPSTNPYSDYSIPFSECLIFTSGSKCFNLKSKFSNISQDFLDIKETRTSFIRHLKRKANIMMVVKPTVMWIWSSFPKLNIVFTSLIFLSFEHKALWIYTSLLHLHEEEFAIIPLHQTIPSFHLF